MRKIKSNRAVFLDRDGVINKKAPEGDYIKSWAEFVFLPNVKKAIKELNENNFKVFVVTNQRGIAKGLMSEGDLKDIHKNMQSELKENGAKIDAVYYCPHEKGECNCRKPDIGMFKQAKVDFPKIQLEDSFVIGDSLKDMKAGNKIGSTTILISNTQSEQSEDEGSLANHNVSSLFKAVKTIESIIQDEKANCRTAKT